MACTVAVEESITEHYNDQIRELLKRDPELHSEMIQLLKKFRDEEQEHHDIGRGSSPIFYRLLIIIMSKSSEGCNKTLNNLK